MEKSAWKKKLEAPVVEELLIAHHEQLDTNYVETWLTQFAEALDNPAILAEYHRLLTQAKS